MNNQQVVDIGAEVTKDNFFGFTCIAHFVTNAIDAIFIIAAVAFFAFLVWGGIQWLISGGDKGKTQEAGNRITAALVGLAIVAASWAIFQLVIYFFGINLESICDQNPVGENGFNVPIGEGGKGKNAGTVD